jgi:methyl-accepting chemotaxis protein
MFSWFTQVAPIRTKFSVLLVIYTSLTGLASVAAFLSIGGFGKFTPSITLSMAGVALVGTIVTALWSKKVICDPYVDTVVRMEGLASGDLTSEIRYTENRDCVGRLTKAMAVFRKNAELVAKGAEAQKIVVSALGKGLSELSTGKLDCAISDNFPPDYEQLRQDFNAAIAELSATLGAVSQSTNGVRTGAGEISQASNDLSQRTEQQAASLEETAAAMDEITSTVREAAANAARANKAVGQARTEAEHSGTVVGRAIDAMGGIERASNEISEIITVIDGIAFQTNLLALNAGVEAARAGDAGRGFAVVASEVRALAQRSADAAKDVKARINASSEQVDAGVELVSETGKALQRIIASIGEVDTLVATIAASSEQQASGLQQVNTAVAEMDGVTQQNAAMVEEATAAARSLAAEADELARHIGRFSLGDDQRAAPANNVHELQARVSTAAKRAPRSARGNAAAAVATDDWSQF